MVELLSPVGDFECLKAAVQNGADSVYFGASMFSARAFAANFDESQLEQAINYAKIRGVKTNLTLNTLIKNSEFEEAYSIAKKSYEMGIDAIIVQDLGLAMRLIKDFPDMDVHGSTQMTVHNLEGAKMLKELGFKRVVLSRELSANEIEYICKNVDIEVEAFIHGALCMSYSGQCLFSSMIGGRSGNRGKCAQTCRLPFELYENEEMIDKGYLLSPRDLCGLEYIPFLINAGVKCFKIEGRMKTPEYVATVTRIYRKYIDLALSGHEYIIEEQDKKELLQVFNRGGFSKGHLDENANTDLVFKEKSNNMGIYLGNILEYNKSKGLITLKLNEIIQIGDGISTENETGKYTISELIKSGNNVKIACPGDIVTIGRMKGNISLKDKVYKLESKELTRVALESFAIENKKRYLNIKITIKREEKIRAKIRDLANGLEAEVEYDYIPLNAENKPLDREKIIMQFSKTNDTPYEFKNFDIELEDGLFLPVSILNDLRRMVLVEYENKLIDGFKRVCKSKIDGSEFNTETISENVENKNISLLLNMLDLNFDYSKLTKVDRLYIPLEYWENAKFEPIFEQLKNNNLYIYMPTIIRKKYEERAKNILNKAFEKYDIKGIVVSNISQLNLIYKGCGLKNKVEIIANYTMNIYNRNTIKELSKMGVNHFTISPELNKDAVLELCSNKNMELIVYSNIPVMTANYCFLGKANKCTNSCTGMCKMGKNKYYLKDRMGFKFRIIPNSTQTITTIYNCKTTSISPKDFNTQSVRIDILNESIEEMNEIISAVSSDGRMEGQEFTNSNMNREM